MRRMISWTLLTTVIVALALVGPALAQDDNGPATIITFRSSVPFISVADLEAGETTATLTWVAVGLDEDQRLVLDRYELNGFVSLMNADETSLSATGARDVPVTSPASFAMPTYRLSIIDFRNRIVDQQIVTIAYVSPAEGDSAAVEFSVDASTLEPTALAAGNARVTVSWTISNRPPTANPVFEQVLPGGDAVNVELPREFLWVQSSGTGAVAPVAPETGDTIQLRLRVVDMIDGTVYAEESATLPTSGVVAPDTGTEAPAEGTDEAPVADSSAAIIAFTASPETVALGDSVQLNWIVTGASSVQISVRTGTSIEQELIAGDLPLRAGLMIPITEDLFAGVPSLTFVIRPVDAAGAGLGLGRADVTIGPAAAATPAPEPTDGALPVEATVEAQG